MVVGAVKLCEVWNRVNRLDPFSNQHLQGRRKGDPQKARIARRLRDETTMTLVWIAGQLHMGAATHVACMLCRQKQKGGDCENTLF